MIAWQSAQEMLAHLVKRGCFDLSSFIDPSQYDPSAVTLRGLREVWPVKTKTGVMVAVKFLQPQLLREGGDKGIKACVPTHFQTSSLLSLISYHSDWHASCSIGQKQVMRIFKSHLVWLCLRIDLEWFRSGWTTAHSMSIFKTIPPSIVMILYIRCLL